VSGLEERFKSLEHGVPDVVVELTERRDYDPILYLDSLIEDYVDASANMWLQCRLRPPNGDNLRASHLERSVSHLPEIVDISGLAGHSDDRFSMGKRGERRGNLSVLVPVCRFVEQPEGMLVELIPSWVWCNCTDFGLRRVGHVTDTPVPRFDRGTPSEDWEGDILLLLRRQTRSVGFGECEGQVVEAIPQCLERVPDNKSKFVGEWLQHFATELAFPFAVGLFEDSVTVAAPFGEQRFDLPNVALSVDKLSAVAE